MKDYEKQELFGNSSYRQFQGSILSVVENAEPDGISIRRLADMRMPGKNELVSRQIAQSAIADLVGLNLITVDKAGTARNLPDDDV